MTDTPYPEASGGLPQRKALGWALLGAVLGASTVGAMIYWQLAGLNYAGAQRPTLSPGEFDLLLTARALASFDFLPLWAGSVHPDAIGTYLGAFEVAAFLLLGLGSTAALKACGVLHFALLSATCTGLAARMAGARAGALSLALILFVAPTLLGYHTRFLATTTEVIGIQVLALWWLLELRWNGPHARGARVNSLFCGLLLGVALIYSSHSFLLLLFSPLFLVLHSGSTVRERLPQLVPLFCGVAAFSAPWKLLAGVPGQQPTGLTLKSVPVTTILANLGMDDLTTLVQRLPFALSDSSMSGTPSRWLYVGWLVTLIFALIWAGLSLFRRDGRAENQVVEGLLGCYGLAALTPMLFAGSLAGYPAAYRYCFNGLVIGIVLIGLQYAKQHRSTRLPGARAVLSTVVAATVVPCVLAWLAGDRQASGSSWEMTRDEAAFFAAQHRVLILDEAPHRHFGLLSPHVQEEERRNWFQGYGMLLGEEFQHRRALARKGGGRDNDGASADVWLQVPELHSSEGLAASFSTGLGLGLALDATLSSDDLVLIASLPNSLHADLWFGIGAALAERSYWSRTPPELSITGSPQALNELPNSMDALKQGYVSIHGATAEPIDSLVTFASDDNHNHGAPAAYLSLSHPFIFTRFAQEGRGEFK
jgi:hypothetical protein